MSPTDKIPTIGTDSVITALVVIALITAGATVGTGSVAAQSAQSGGDEYAVVQDGECFTIEAFGNGSQSVEEFYDYRTPETEPSSYLYGSFGTQELQEDDTSNLFLYNGSEGTSLVVVHDQVEGNSSGAAVTMQFDGLPEDGEWAVEDDNYSEHLGDGPFDEFERDGTSSRATWVYTDNRSDGGAFRGLEGDTNVTIDPAFNDDADFRLYEGQITEWRALSPTDDGYEETSLDMDEPVEIRSGSCTSVTATDLETDESVSAGDDLGIEATVENDGAMNGTFEVPITVDGEVVDEREVTLEPGETTTVSTTVTLEEAGTYTVGVAGETTEVTVDGEGGLDVDGEGGLDEELPGFGIGSTIAALATLLALSLARYRR